jgi:1,2-phenylacetyl-CoA epoxidase catalytic subunit
MVRLSSEERELLTRMLTSHAYREKLAVERFKEAIRLLPSNQSERYWLNVIEEEQEHYDGCLLLANELGLDLEPLVAVRMLRQPAGIPPFYSWLDVLLAHAFNDRAGYHVLVGLIGSKVRSYGILAEQIIAEEEAHGTSGATALVDYYSSLPDTPERGHTLLKHLDAAVACLGHPNTLGDSEAVRSGLKTRSAEATLMEFCKDVDGVLAKLDRQDLIPIILRYKR